MEWYQDPLTRETMCEPVECNDGRTYDLWTIVDRDLTRSPLDPNHTDFRIVGPDLDLQDRLFAAFPEQKARFVSRWRSHRKEAAAAVRGGSGGNDVNKRGDDGEAPSCGRVVCAIWRECVCLPCLVARRLAALCLSR